MTDIGHRWLETLADLRARQVPCVLVTVAETRGSAPREAGTKMIATTDQQFGTIGGGNLEAEAVRQARELLDRTDHDNRLARFPLGPSLAQCCGGVVTVLLEPFLPPRKRLLLFGAGHVGRAIVEVLSGLGLRIHWIDPREDQFPEPLPDAVEKVHTDAPTAELHDCDEDTYVLIVSHSHDLDYRLVETTLARNRFAYLGLIGSASKRARFEKRLRQAGIPDETLARLTCPIGLPAIAGKHPKEIAIATAAELLGLGLTESTRTDPHDGPGIP